jgi:hypothetical protein
VGSAAHRLCVCAAVVSLAVSAHGCGGSGAGSQPSVRQALAAYLREIEPIRLAVNRLLEGADPTLAAFHEHRLSEAAAGARLGTLERRFAAFAVEVAEIRPRVPALSTLHDAYAQTYVLEDAYLSALASGIQAGDLGHLPDTQAEQRAAIVRWRIGLEVLSRTAQVPLPADLQQAGRGEIAPSPRGES